MKKVTVTNSFHDSEAVFMLTPEIENEIAGFSDAFDALRYLGFILQSKPHLRTLRKVEKKLCSSPEDLGGCCQCMKYWLVTITG